MGVALNLLEALTEVRKLETAKKKRSSGCSYLFSYFVQLFCFVKLQLSVICSAVFFLGSLAAVLLTQTSKSLLTAVICSAEPKKAAILY